MLFAILCMGAMRLFGQGQDANYQWVGNTISYVTSSSDTDITTFYLYNVGSGKYLNIGSYWGTSVSAFKVGMPLKFEANGDGTYKIQGTISSENGKYLGFPQAGIAGDAKQFDWDRIYCDRGVKNTGDHCNWVIADVSTGGKTYYTLYVDNGTYSDAATQALIGGNRYLAVDVNKAKKRNDITYPASVGTSDEAALWQIVTLKDLKDAFKEQFASNEDPADATFLLADQNFDIGNADVEKWVRSNLSSTIGYGGVYTYAFSPLAPNTFFVGNRGVMADNFQRYYGQYWIGSIRNAGNDTNANGTMTQAVTTLKKGWYRVSCDGFYNADSSSDMVATLFAKVNGATGGESNVSAELNLLNGAISYTMDSLTYTSTKHNGLNANYPGPYVQAARLFETGNYNNSILVYVPNNGDVLNIGIEVAGSTGNLDWTAFDNFQLQYCGNADMILDEAQTSIDYITKQVDANHANTLILKRTLTPGLWSSITLPVSLTAAQFKTAFGDQAKLATLKGQSASIASRIDFESVDLTNDNNTAIEPGKLYIMQSTRSGNVSSGSYSKIIETGTTITVTAPYFVINNVVLDATPAAIFKETAKTSTTVDAKLQFCGTQISQTSTVVPKYSYVLGAKNGLWHYTQNDLSIKGFRCWIATGDNVSSAKSMVFAIDGVEEGQLTQIDNIMTNGTSVDGNVYSINGQLVRRNTTSLDGLGKGIYIVNGKKYVIK